MPLRRRDGKRLQVARDSRPVAARHGGARGLLVAALAATVVVAACSRGKTTASPTPPTVPATTATTVPQTTTTLDPKQQVIAAYQDSLNQYRRVAGDPNGSPDDPILRGTLTTKMAQQIAVNIFGLRSLHRYTKGNVLLHPQQIDIQGSSATVIACLRDDSDQYDQSGRDVSPHPGMGTPMQVKAVLLQSADGRWLVDQNSPTGKPCTI
jgi:hypothetical protein